MICPHCDREIDDGAIAAHLGAKGGRKGKRAITTAQQAALQAARMKTAIYRAAARKLSTIPHGGPTSAANSADEGG